jgi:hypothetical protein
MCFVVCFLMTRSFIQSVIRVAERVCLLSPESPKITLIQDRLTELVPDNMNQSAIYCKKTLPYDVIGASGNVLLGPTQPLGRPASD